MYNVLMSILGRAGLVPAQPGMLKMVLARANYFFRF